MGAVKPVGKGSYILAGPDEPLDLGRDLTDSELRRLQELVDGTRTFVGLDGWTLKMTAEGPSAKPVVEISERYEGTLRYERLAAIIGAYYDQ
jgi:hypothetical protein